jgi:uncharacterized protein YjeT (DUF2065 family)
MEKSMSSGLRTTFLAHAIVAILLGLGYLLIPEMVGGILQWDMSDPAYRTLGAAMLSIGIMSWLGYRASLWDEVKITVQFEIVWTVLGAVVLVWMLLTGAAPMAAWLNVAVLVVFAILFGYFYTRD